MYTAYTPSLDVSEMDFDSFYPQFANAWQQGEHVALVGQTGTGKTTLANDLLNARDYVISLAIKRRDDTLNLFKENGYRVIKPRTGLSRILFGHVVIPYDAHHVVMNFRPKNLRDTVQQMDVYRIMDKVFQDGGWCLYLDDTGYVTGSLGLKRPLVVMLSQARSNGTSLVTALVQPTSITQGVPTEALRQIRHLFAWRYLDDSSIDAIARIGGVNKKLLPEIMPLLADHDFLYIHGGTVTLVRNTWSM